MREDLLVRAATVRFDTVAPTDPIARRAAEAYFTELDTRFDGGFDAVAQAAADPEKLSAPGGVFVVAASDGTAVACGGVQTIADRVGEIKRMWVDPTWRGAGLGRRLLRLLEERSAGLGHRTVRLDTHGTLTEAIAMYRRAGYAEVERYNDNPYAQLFFEKPLTPTRLDHRHQPVEPTASDAEQVPSKPRGPSPRP